MDFFCLKLHVHVSIYMYVVATPYVHVQQNSVMIIIILLSKNITTCTCQYLSDKLIVPCGHTLFSRNLLDHVHEMRKGEGQVVKA